MEKTTIESLIARAHASKRGILIEDSLAEHIANDIGDTDIKNSTMYYYAMRARVIDDYITMHLDRAPSDTTTVLYIGAHMSTAHSRIGNRCHAWYDIDTSSSITLMRQYIDESPNYRMIGVDDMLDIPLDRIESSTKAVVIIDNSYLNISIDDINSLLNALPAKFDTIAVLIDTLTASGAKRLAHDKHMCHLVGVSHPHELIANTLYNYVTEYSATPNYLMDTLPTLERLYYRAIHGRSQCHALYEYRYSM